MHLAPEAVNSLCRMLYKVPRLRTGVHDPPRRAAEMEKSLIDKDLRLQGQDDSLCSIASGQLS